MLRFGEINKKIIYLGIPIIITIFEYCYGINRFNHLYREHVIIFKICQALSMFLSIIPFIILKKKSQIKYNPINSNTKKLHKKEYNEKIRKRTITKYTLIPLTAILTYVFKLIHYYYFHRIGTFFSFWLLDLVFISIFSFLILKTKFYRHQFFSIIIMIIFGIILNIINTLKGIDLKKLFSKTLNHMLYSFNMVIKKYIIDYTFCYASELLTYDGLITLVLFIITLIFSTKYEMKTNDCKHTQYNGKCYLDNYYAYYETLNKKEVFIFIFVLLYYVVYHFFFYVTLKEFTALHIFLILIFEEDILYDIFFANNVAKKDKWKLYANIFIFFIFLFMLLVLTEIIEIDCCGLADNTKRNIIKRAGSIDSGAPKRSTQNEDITPYNDDNDDMNDSLIELDKYHVAAIIDDYDSKKDE